MKKLICWGTDDPPCKKKFAYKKEYKFMCEEKVSWNSVEYIEMIGVDAKSLGKQQRKNTDVLKMNDKKDVMSDQIRNSENLGSEA